MAEPWTYPINAFNGGELSPSLYGRSDLAKYASSAALIKNFYIQPEGGLVRRSGTRFVKPLQDETTASRFIAFIFSTEQAYVLEFGNLFMKVYKDEGVVLNTAENVEGITNADPAVVTITGHSFSNGDEVYIASVEGMTEINGRFYTVANKAANTFELSGIDSSDYGTYTSGGTCASVYKLVTTYTSAQVAAMTFAQSADTLYIAHQAHAPAKLTRTSHTSWTLTSISLIDGPYPYLNYTPTIINAIGPGPGVEHFIASGTDGINDGDGFKTPQDVGRHYRHEYREPGSEKLGWGTIDTVNDVDDIDVDVQQIVSIANVSTWRLGSFYPGNYPYAVCLAEGRLWFGGEPLAPYRFYASESGIFEKFSPTGWESQTPNDNNAISYAVAVNQVNEILWIETGRSVILGTPGGVFPVLASSLNEPVSPFNVNVPSPMPYGAAAIKPSRVGNTVVYIDRTQRSLRGVVFSVDSGGYSSIDLTRRARHISVDGLAGVDYQLMPDSIVWCWKSDGTIAALTYVPEEDVLAWSRHILGGSFGSSNAIVESMAVIPMPDASGDQVWMLVKRTINGATHRYVEFMEEKFLRDDDIEDGFFVDCGLTYDGAEATTISGLLHLEGETVAVLADGFVVSDKVVSGGAITLAYAASKVHVGLGFNSDVGSLSLDTPANQPSGAAGTSRGILKRPNTFIVRFDATNTGLYGPDSGNLSPIPFRDAGDALDTPTPLFSGEKELTVEPGWDREAKFFFRQDKPLPFTILSITALGEGGSR